jgi:hypothetical protein
MNLFGKRVFTDMSKIGILRWDLIRLFWWTLNLMRGSTSYKRRRREETQRRPCEGRQSLE